jgi:hypothetical protein
MSEMVFGSRLCTFLETILTMVWYPTCVATLSRYTKVGLTTGQILLVPHLRRPLSRFC